MISLSRNELKVVANRLSVVARNAGASQPLMGEAKDGVLTLWYNGMDIVIWHIIEGVSEDMDLFSVPIDRFVGLVNSLTYDEIKLSVTNDSLNVQGGRSRVKIPFYGGAFDEIEEIPEGTSELMWLPVGIAGAFKNAPNFTAKTGAGNLAYTTIHLSVQDDKFLVTATDQYRMYRQMFDKPRTWTGELNAMIPKNVGDTLAVLLSDDMRIGITQLERGYMLFETDDGFTLRTATNNLNYPNVDRAFTQEFNDYFSFNKSEFLSLLKMDDVLSDENKIEVKRVGEDIILSIPKRDLNDFGVDIEAELYLEEIELFTDDEFIMHLNIPFLTQIVKLCESDELVFKRSVDGKRIEVHDPIYQNKYMQMMEFWRG